jgi:hypothetical protein
VRSLRAASLLGVLLALGALAVAALLAVYVPLKLLSMVSERKLDSLAAGIFAPLSIAAGGVIAFFAIVIGYALVAEELEGERVSEDAARRRELEERLTAYRARQRAMLEELDEVRKLLEEIRDLLKEGVGA